MRANKAVAAIKIYLQHHLKTDDIKLGEELNKAIWTRGDSKPPATVTVVVKMEEKTAYAELVGKEFKKKDFSDKEEKKEKPKAEEKAEKKETPKVEKETELEGTAAEIIGKAAVAKTKAETPKAAEKKSTPKKKVAKK